MQFADPPFLESILFESPWVTTAVLLIAGFALFWHGARIDDKRFRRAALGAVILAAIVCLTAFLVTTPRQALRDQAGDLVHATAPFDGTRFGNLIDPDAGVIGPDGSIWLQGGSAISLALQRAIERYGVIKHFVRVRGVDVDGPRGRSHVVVRTFLAGEYSGRPVRTEWLMTWTRTTDGQWRMATIQWLDLNGQEPPKGIIW